MSLEPLRAELEALASALDEVGLRLTVGGGIGLVLRAERLLKSGERTLMPIPVARATDDIDAFLPIEVVVDAEKMKILREVIDALGYEPIETAKYYQFVKTVRHRGRDAKIKLDLLAPPPRDTSCVVVDERRVRAKGYRKIHAHTAPEAFSVEESSEPFELSGIAVGVPHAFAYVMLKTHALRDQVDDVGKGWGGKHAFDIYAAVAMLTEAADREFVRYREQFSDHPSFLEAQRICAELFSGPDSKGTLRLREFARDSQEPLDDDTVALFLSELKRLIEKPKRSGSRVLRRLRRMH